MKMGSREKIAQNKLTSMMKFLFEKSGANISIMQIMLSSTMQPPVKKSRAKMNFRWHIQ